MHTKFITSNDKSFINITIGSFPYEDYEKIKFKQYFAGAKDITCKLISADSIAN